MYLKKLFEIIGLSILICFSFILTEKTANIFKNEDKIMMTIKENSLDLEIKSIDAIIKKDEMIPGLSGKIVNIEKSYKAMKKLGFYQENRIVYQQIKPTISINEYYDKYIVRGNPEKRQVALIFKLEKDIKINDILKILEDRLLNVNFFVDTSWVKNNTDYLLKIISAGHILGNLSSDDLKLLNSIIRKRSTQKKYYCYCEQKDLEVLKECSENKYFTIVPQFVIKNDLLTNTKQQLQTGSIISIDINKSNLIELANTLDYITSKGFQIVTLDQLLEE